MELGISVETAVRRLLQNATSRSLVDKYLRVMEPGMCHPSHIEAALAAANQHQHQQGVAIQEHEESWGALPFTSRLLLVAGGAGVVHCDHQLAAGGGIVELQSLYSHC
jgi:hypothetical protein